LARGQSVIEIGGLKEPMNIELGWWFHKNIVGAVFDTGSPLLKYLPESKFLSTLHFRIFKKGLAMPVNGFPADSLAVVGEEQAMCRANLGERVDAKGGQHIFAYGLALDQPLPEAVAMLDGLVDRARNQLPSTNCQLQNKEVKNEKTDNSDKRTSGCQCLGRCRELEGAALVGVPFGAGCG
jgi:hypothetical protein